MMGTPSASPARWRSPRWAAWLLAVILLAPLYGWAAGCGTAVTHGTAVALDAFDLEIMSAQMAQSMMADPQVQRAIEEEGRLAVVVMPVENRLRGEVLPTGQARAFTAQVRWLLGRANPESFIWINNRETFYALRDRELDLASPDVDPGPSPDAMNPAYALHATFTSIADVDRRRRAAFYQCQFELTDLRDRRVIWSDAYNVRKQAVARLLDR